MLTRDKKDNAFTGADMRLDISTIERVRHLLANRYEGGFYISKSAMISPLAVCCHLGGCHR